MTQLLKDQVAIVTGGASGIGRATVELFVEHGAKVVIADIDRGQGAALADSLGSSVCFFEVDVTDAARLQTLVDTAIDHFGDLHVMFNNAGISGAVHDSFLNDDFADFDQVMKVNLLAVLRGSQYAARYMKTKGRGSIINTSSIGALKFGMPVLTYRAAKVGMIHASKCIAKELGEYGIRVNCIAPGHIPGAMTFYDVTEMIQRTQPLLRQGMPQDVANAALYLASDLSAQVTGTVIPVDGGSCLGGPLHPYKKRDGRSA